jgi:hypothetical protein
VTNIVKPMIQTCRILLSFKSEAACMFGSSLGSLRTKSGVDARDRSRGSRFSG